MAKGTISINSDNILPIIKKWLYSDKDIFLRELISNSCDAINKLKFLNENFSKNFRIDVNIDKTKKTLTITDNGIGMTKEEVKKYIAQIAFSGAKEFLEKYQSENTKDQIIGHFGLGFYSAYMVAKKVEIKTKSHKKEEGVFWECDGSSNYTIKPEKIEKRGTKIILHIDEKEEEFLEEERIREILTKYCPYLPFPIYLNNTLFNNKDPLFLKSPSQCEEKEYLKFYKELYPLENDPIFWIHLNVDYPFHLKGILYFPKLSNLNSEKNTIKLFCNRVFVSENCKDLLPDYLTILKGAIDSPDIPLNVSRSFLQMDRNVRKIGSHISKKICDKLSNLFLTEKEKFISSFEDIETIIKLGILQDEKFYERAKSFLIWKNTEDSWTTIEEYLERNKEKHENKIFYSHEKNSNFLDLYKKKKIEVIFTNPYIDTAILNFLESKLSVKFQRIDGDVDSSILDPSKEKTVLEADGKSKVAKIEEFIKSALPDIEVQAKSLSDDFLPGFIMLSEEERRFRDYMNLTNQKLSAPTKKTFVVNTNNKVVMKAYALKDTKKELAKDLVIQLYNLAMLSQRELPPEKLNNFITHSTKVLEKLSSLNS
jgi:molecular chaperone HtpG